MRGQNAARAAAYKDNLVMDILQKRTWAQIDLDAAAHNFKEIRRYVGNRSMVCCVIKADAYGHGAVRMAEEYEALGAFQH